VRSSNAQHLIVRTAWVYSPFGHNFVKTIMRAAETREVLTVVDDQLGNPSCALDLADGLLRVLHLWREERETGLGETYHLAGTGATTWCGLARAIMAECRNRDLPTAEVRPIATADWPTKAARPANSMMSSAKFTADFGSAMPAWEQSLAAVMDRLAERPVSSDRPA
jgi:dTDP-4-dehydrorhamnose reductase